MSGFLITIEGGEGVGKSTQMRLLADRLRSAGLAVLTTREPGGTDAGNRIRDLLLDPEAQIAPVTELFLYEASRAEHVAEVIAPALEQGAFVICDRFFDSTTAYQAYGRGLPLETVHALNLAATGGLVPDVTVLLALDLEHAMERATREGADRIEAASLDFHRRVIDGFRAIADSEPERFLVIDASGTPDEVAQRVWAALSSHPYFERASAGAARS